MKCESLTCMEMDSCEFCKNVADKYLQTLKIIADIEQLLDELMRSAVTEKVKIEGTYSAMLFAITPLLTALFGLVKPGNVPLAGLQAVAAMALVTIFAKLFRSKRASSGEEETAFTENLEADSKGAEPDYFDIEELSAVLDEFKKIADAYKLILNKCAEKCGVKMEMEKSA